MQNWAEGALSTTTERREGREGARARARARRTEDLSVLEIGRERDRRHRDRAAADAEEPGEEPTRDADLYGVARRSRRVTVISRSTPPPPEGRRKTVTVVESRVGAMGGICVCDCGRGLRSEQRPEREMEREREREKRREEKRGTRVTTIAAAATRARRPPTAHSRSSRAVSARSPASAPAAGRRKLARTVAAAAPIDAEASIRSERASLLSGRAGGGSPSLAGDGDAAPRPSSSARCVLRYHLSGTVGATAICRAPPKHAPRSRPAVGTPPHTRAHRPPPALR